MSEFKGLIIVIPTRNRASMAITAVKSVLAYAGDDIKLVVSDNSTEQKEIEILAEFCKTLNDSRTKYIIPPEPLAMTIHWDWIINYIMDNFEENHFVYLPDRVVFKTVAIKELIDAIKIYPDEIISYNTDVVWDCDNQIKIYPENKAYKLERIDSKELISNVGNRIESPRALPKMLNSVAPRSVLDNLKSKYGKIFDSISPDYSFGFRIMANYDSIIYCEKSLIINYGYDRSNGINFGKGKLKGDSSDFFKNLDKKDGNYFYLSPVPELMTFHNAIIHEYYFIKNESGNSKFEDINKAKYFEVIEEDIQKFVSSKDRQKALNILKERGASPKGEFYYYYKKYRKIFNLRKNFIAIKEKFFPEFKFNNSLEAIEYLNNLSC